MSRPVELNRLFKQAFPLHLSLTAFFHKSKKKVFTASLGEEAVGRPSSLFFLSLLYITNIRTSQS